MPKRYDPILYDEATRKAIEKAAEKIREQHEASTLLNRKAARRWLEEKRRKAEKQDLLDDLEEADLDEEE